ncbi:MAG: hypothetical protein EOP39_03670 [Rubrivivax sp.]|nr:MAG: hypothetical protein EOP39_03670 [Rubrivivax sp.]
MKLPTSAVALFAAFAAFAAQAADKQTPEQAELRAECAKSYTDTSSVAMPVAANEYQFVYSSGKYKGEARPGKLLPCTSQQYAAYLDNKADPAKVMSAYPTAAGRPTTKKKAEPFRL